jgi:hypothetical protein
MRLTVKEETESNKDHGGAVSESVKEAERNHS